MSKYGLRLKCTLLLCFLNIHSLGRGTFTLEKRVRSLREWVVEVGIKLVRVGWGQ